MNTKNEQPFFVKFLEGQEFPGVRTNIKAGLTAVTLKYPSDSDEPEPPQPPGHPGDPFNLEP